MNDDSLHKNDSDNRVEALFWAEIFVSGSQIPATMIGLSSKSIELECNTNIPIGTECDICIQLVNRKNTDLPVICSGTISGHSEDGLIFEIHKVDDNEGLENLKNIILFHSSDPQQAVRDLES